MLTLLIDSGIIKKPRRLYPALKRQVNPMDWVRKSQLRASAEWGLQLGSAVLTYVEWSGTFVVLSLAAAMGLPLSVLIMAIYGLARGSQPLMDTFYTSRRGLASMTFKLAYDWQPAVTVATFACSLPLALQLVPVGPRL